MPANTSRRRKLLVATGVLGVHTSYNRLAEYTPDSKLVTGDRIDPSGVMHRTLVSALSRLAFTRHYRLGSLEAEWKTWREYITGRWDLIHVLWGDNDLGFLDLASQLWKVPLCVTMHGCPDTLPDTLKHSARLRRLGAVILMSECQKDFFVSRGVAADRLHVIHHGVDCEFFRPAACGLSVEPFRVIFVGNYRRNFGLLRDVCERLLPYPHVQVRIVAPEVRKSMFCALSNVEFVSGLSDERLLRAYQQSSCLLMTVEAATANNAVLEALACGLPLVAENVGGISEYVGHGTARLVSAGDAQGLASAILELSYDPALLLGMAVLARKRAESLAWPLVQERTEEIYSSLLQDHERQSLSH